ncbi:Rrf2 family transcriptional regulator [Acetobacter sp.]|jgi:Rrf2 family nitric oxide-sensitive transcriptional repressor|uniref:Rrf2 family transcriptional regulator n=1 Tax=Acetobacter sp. TaxID=440 RepID=UPI0025BCCF51|nr:Rrf2 family transcriptional regulator [Acetobacter sp.]MCH4092488.1 Rrf2 family transcriptional regulator [Acetobacter sp.]MCI1299622.1 Rrf2 family transcriptional regulator [Acetobacter sp.]MCI1315498.1 Rrf2 family transcriptional regulator [Acetobacter sp.]
MRLTLHTDYALRALIFLTWTTDRLASIREIATTYGISENHLVKIVHKLGQQGFIETVRGRNGGIRLARDASQICVGDVVRVIEEGLEAAGTKKELLSEEPGRLLPQSRFRDVVNTALKAFMAVLDETRLSDLIFDEQKQMLGIASSPRARLLKSNENREICGVAVPAAP